MGQRSPSESIAAIFQAFLKKRTWSQVDLAREVEVQVPALKKQLTALERKGLPLEREEDHPHVYWSVSKDWFPGGALLRGPELALLLRYLARAARSPDRDRLIQSLARTLTSSSGATDLTRVLEPADEAEHLAAIEDSAGKKRALHCRYLSSKGVAGWRKMSVQRVFSGPPPRFIAFCHNTERLKWFRVDAVLAAKFDDEPFRDTPDAEIQALVDASLDGFADIGPKKTYAFTVRAPESRWVSSNLLKGMKATTNGDGIHVEVTTTALPIVARFVVGLGAAARCESDELSEAVTELARGALDASILNKRPADPNR